MIQILPSSVLNILQNRGIFLPFSRTEICILQRIYILSHLTFPLYIFKYISTIGLTSHNPEILNGQEYNLIYELCSTVVPHKGTTHTIFWNRKRESDISFHDDDSWQNSHFISKWIPGGKKDIESLNISVVHSILTYRMKLGKNQQEQKQHKTQRRYHRRAI